MHKTVGREISSPADKEKKEKQMVVGKSQTSFISLSPHNQSGVVLTCSFPLFPSEGRLGNPQALLLGVLATLTMQSSS